MALFCADQTQPDRDAPKIVRVLSHKHVKDGDYTSYIIQVNVGDISWTLERRYSEFEKFDRERFCEKLRKQSILPGKKLIGNQDEDFLQERQSELEKYLRAILQLELFIAQKRHLTAIPKLLGRFLDFDQYEVHAICERLSESWADQLDSAAGAAASDGFVELTPLQLYAVTQRLALPEPTTAGLSRVLSLELLNVRDNSLRCPSDVRHAGQLPVLHTLLLNGNPVTHAVEYRTRVLEAFDRRAADVRLDGKRASARERDLVAVRLAIRKAREEKEALLERTRADISHKLRLLTPDEQRDNNADDDDSNAAQYGECSVSLP